MRQCPARRRFMNHAQLTVPKMMEDYGINRRTANRDLNDLQELGVELEDRVRGDGLKTWSIPKKARRINVGYNLTDLTALFMGRRLFDFLRGTELEQSLDKVYERIEGQLDREKDLIKASDLARKVYLISEGPKQLGEQHVECLDAIFTGLIEQKKVKMRYRNAQGEANDRVICPYTLVAYRRGLYVLGLVDGTDKMRTYAIERIEDAEFIRGTSFDFPADFDPEGHFKNSFFLQTGKPEKVELLFSKTTEPFIKIRQFHHSQKVTRTKDGRIRMTLQVPAGEWDFEIVNFVLSFHENVEVVKPAYLRESVKKKLKSALKLYR